MTECAKKKIRRSMLLLLAIAVGGYGLISWMFPSSSQAQASVAGQLQEKDLYDSKLLDAFYQERGMRTIWLRGATRFQPRAEATLRILKDSWTHGLNPENYHVSKLEAWIADDTNLNRYAFDQAMTDGVLRYTRDLTGMRGKHNPNDKAGKYWREPMEPQVIIDKVVLAADPVSTLKSLEPSGKLYQALRQELVTLAAIKRSAHEPLKTALSLKPGNSYPVIPLVREKLGLAPDSAAPEFFDDALAAEIMKFQRRNGINADGVIKADTVAALNRDPESKMMQVIANMERLRWMEQGRPDRYILVNIPSASLWAVENGDVAMEMPVIIGKTARPTYSFKTEITGVRFNPNWTVPPTIKNDDFLPMLQQDPLVLAKRGIRIMYQGKEVDPTKVDWSTVTKRNLSSVRMIQSPGDDNPLGKVRVIMENPYNIYLHDTNHREMFESSERALSSGCIRVSEPEKLADFILKKNDGWTWNGMQKMIDSGRMRDVQTQEKMPVYITYQTIWLDSEGKLIYGPDVYGQDAALSQILKKADGIHIPQTSEKTEISL